MIPDYVAAFVAAVSRQFSLPKLSEADTESWMRDYGRVLGKWPPQIVARAAQIIIETRTDGRFPRPAECDAACRTADAERAAKVRDENLLSHGERDQSPWASWRIDRADELLKTTALGRQAASEGWALALHDYIRANQRLPPESDVGRLMAQAAEMRGLVETCERGEAGPVSGPLARLGRSILERGKDMAEFVAGKGDATWRR